MNIMTRRSLLAALALSAATLLLPQDATLEEMDALWDEAKAAEKKQAAE